MSLSPNERTRLRDLYRCSLEFKIPQVWLQVERSRDKPFVKLRVKEGSFRMRYIFDGSNWILNTGSWIPNNPGLEVLRNKLDVQKMDQNGSILGFVLYRICCCSSSIERQNCGNSLNMKLIISPRASESACCTYIFSFPLIYCCGFESVNFSLKYVSC